MSSRTSRGVPEWSGGKELYIGSAISAIGTSFGVTGIVPGPPEGSRGSTGWGHLSRRAQWAEVGGEPAPGGLVRPPWAPPPPRVGNPRGGGRLHLPWGASHPLGRRPPWRSHLLGPVPPPGAPIYSGGEGGQQHHSPCRLPLPPATPLRPACAWRSPAGIPLLQPPRRRAAGSPSTSPSPLLDQEGGDVFPTVRVLNAEVPSVRH